MKTHRERRRRIVVVLAMVTTVAACVHEQITGSRSSSLLVIDRIGAARAGAAEEAVSTLLRSDVSTAGTVGDDIGQVTTRLALKDPGSVDNPAFPTTSNYVTVTRYRVEYVRADGRNTPGVDVPFPFDSGVTFTTTTDVQTAEFVLVRASAKLEAPLLALRGSGGAIVINTIAEVTFYGHDQTGTEVIASGRIGITFADWGGDGDGAGAPRVTGGAVHRGGLA